MGTTNHNHKSLCFAEYREVSYAEFSQHLRFASPSGQTEVALQTSPVIPLVLPTLTPLALLGEQRQQGNAAARYHGLPAKSGLSAKWE